MSAVLQAFDDPRHRLSEERAFDAERLARRGDLDGARKKYSEAAEPELDLARGLGVGGTDPKLRSIFAISAITCLVRAERWDDAIRASHEFLASPEWLLPDAVGEVEALLDDAQRTRELVGSIPSHADFAPLEVRLEGGRVKRGIAPSQLVQQREEIIETLLFRVADWRARKRFRRAGKSSFVSRFTFWEAPARAASYGIRFFVTSTSQTPVPGAEVSPADAINALLELATAAAEGPDRLHEVAGDDAYAKAFTRAFRDLAPDGTAVATVSLSSPGTLARREVVHLSPRSRAELSKALVAGSAEALRTIEGVLKVVSLKKGNRKIVVERDDGAMHDMRLPSAEHDDTIGPKLNRRVAVTAVQQTKPDGTVVTTARDVVLIETDALELSDGTEG